MSVESWKSFFDIASVILVLLTFFAGAGVLVTGNIINKQQEAQLRVLRGDQANTKERAGKLEHDNLALRGQVATLEINAAEANKGLAGLRTTAANAEAAQQRVEIELAKQRELTAAAEKELLELQQRVKSRHLEPEQRAKLVSALRAGLKGGLTIEAEGLGEPMNFAMELLLALADGGWEPTTAQPSTIIEPGEQHAGVYVCVNNLEVTPNRAIGLVKTLADNGINAKLAAFAERVPKAPPDDARSVLLLVGLKE